MHFLTYGNLTLLNVEGCKPLYDEVLVEDCYRRERVPHGSAVLDVGGFGGEFGVWCAINREAFVRIYEPSPVVIVAQANCVLNNANALAFPLAVAKTKGSRKFAYVEDRAYTSHLDHAGARQVDCTTLSIEISEMLEPAARPVVVKLDCEGAEREIFEDESWLPQTNMVLLEFHHKDGERYRDILRRHGFTVETNEPNPEALRGLIWAERDL
jgi:FkbM family methyltransferase